MKLSYFCIDNRLSQCERFWNRIDLVPYVSSYSGMVRILAGMTQIAAGIAFALIKLVHAALKESCYEFKKSWNGIAYSIHGFSNIIRGCIAVFPWINLGFIVYDYKIGRFNYRLEIVPKNIYPLNQDII